MCRIRWVIRKMTVSSLTSDVPVNGSAPAPRSIRSGCGIDNDCRRMTQTPIKARWQNAAMMRGAPAEPRRKEQKAGTGYRSEACLASEGGKSCRRGYIILTGKCQ